jgi:hypothetical protein
VLQYPSHLSSSPFEFSALPPELRQDLERAATIYGLTGLRLHELALEEHSRLRLGQSHKRQRLTSDMSTYSNNALAQDLQEKSPPSNQHGGGFSLGFDGSRIVDGLKWVVCQNCLTRFDAQDGKFPALPCRLKD